jgi:hypothetical protein
LLTLTISGFDDDQRPRGVYSPISPLLNLPNARSWSRTQRKILVLATVLAEVVAWATGTTDRVSSLLPSPMPLQAARDTAATMAAIRNTFINNSLGS